MHHTPLPLVGAFALTFAIASGQEPAIPLTAPTTTPIHTGITLPDGRCAGIWAGGVNYKARFDGGMTYYPHVGAGLPHQPFAWRTVSVRAGATELLPPDGSARLHHSDHLAEYDLGAVTERYEVRADGLAQSFFVPVRPAAGDLVITGQWTSPLRASMQAPAHAPLQLALADGRMVIEYGAAVAIDAHGVRTPMTTAVEGDRIVLRCPAEAIAAATFPLEVDPLITNVLLRQGVEVEDVDVLHETLSPSGSQVRTWVAEARTVAANDNDVRVLRYGSGFGGAGTLAFTELSGWDSTHARLALAPTANAVIMVMSTDATTERVIWVHRHGVNDLTSSTGGDVVPRNAGESHWRPDIGGRRNLNGTRVLIVYQQEPVQPFAETSISIVKACVYDASNLTSPFVVTPFTVRPAANRDQERPVVNQSASSGDWLLAWQEYNNAVANDDWDIDVLAVSGSGVVSGTSVTTEDAGDVSRHKVGPQFAGGGGRYLLTYATRLFEQANPKPTSPEGQIVRAQRIDWDETTNTGSRPWPAVDLFAPGTVTIRAAGLAFDFTSTSHWCAGLRNDANTSYRVHKLGYTGNIVETGTLPLAANASPRAMAIAFNQEGRNFPVVFAENDGSASTNKLQGTSMQYDAVGAVSTLGFACGTGAWANTAAIVDRQQIGAQAMPLQLAGAPIDSAAILFVSMASLPIDGGLLGAPGCWLYPDLFAPNYLGSPAFTLVGGACSTTLDLPEYLPPMTLTMQWVYLVPGANALGMQASEGLSVPIAR